MGMKRSPEARLKMSLAKKGKPPWNKVLKSSQKKDLGVSMD